MHQDYMKTDVKSREMQNEWMDPTHPMSHHKYTYNLGFFPFPVKAIVISHKTWRFLNHCVGLPVDLFATIYCIWLVDCVLLMDSSDKSHDK